ncbi:hypothetical protein [Methylacidimicrobium sp. B4]|uniref:hypothetical protein n=1 Tax=Methylacidimicrobium sp. B4 TaxID=2796139 RepID=UPI001A8C0332|nr:hypothetical protein [Methylacidimicrobium sp. B4]QSR83888.1 hypothetical protein MacB4_06280 [Methylacidimicrobium sp. B4]
MAVRERLLLVLPGKEIYDYLCTGCGASLGQREVVASPGEPSRLAAPLHHPHRHRHRGHRRA